MSEEKKINTSLTAPSDRDKKAGYSLKSTADPLNEKELDTAFKELNVNESLETVYRKIERTYADPKISDQKVGLISFTPSNGAKPDKDGIYGMVKIRGNYHTEEEANERAEQLIRNTDSYHKIFHTFVGRPFPLVEGSDYSEEINRVDLRRKTNEITSAHVKKERDYEKKEFDELKERERALIEDVNKKPEPFETYIEAQVKKANLTHFFMETKEKMERMKKTILECRDIIKEGEEENPKFRDEYKEAYFKKREEVGIPRDENDFSKFLGEDVELKLNF